MSTAAPPAAVSADEPPTAVSADERKSALTAALYFKMLYCRYCKATEALADPERSKLNTREVIAAQTELILELAETQDAHVALAEASHLPDEFLRDIEALACVVAAPRPASALGGDMVYGGRDFYAVSVHLPSSTTEATFDDTIREIAKEVYRRESTLGATQKIPLVLYGDMNCDARRLRSEHRIVAPKEPTCVKKRGYANNPQIHKALALDDAVKDFAVVVTPPGWEGGEVRVEVDLVRPAAQTLTLDMPSDHHAIRVRVKGEEEERELFFWNLFGNTLSGLEGAAPAFAEFISDGEPRSLAAEFGNAWMKEPDELSPRVAAAREALGEVVLGQIPGDGCQYTLCNLVDFELQRPAKYAAPNPYVVAVLRALGAPTAGKFCRSSEFFSRPTLVFPPSQGDVEYAARLPLYIFEARRFAPWFVAEHLTARIAPEATPKLHLSLYGAPSPPYPLAPAAFADLSLERPETGAA